MKHGYDYDYDYNSPADSDSTSRRDFLKTSLLSGAAALTALKVPLAHAQAAPAVQPPFSPIDAANSPMGTAFGVKPGRVSWAFDPKATSWDGVTNAPGWWDDSNTHPEPVAAMNGHILDKGVLVGRFHRQ